MSIEEVFGKFFKPEIKSSGSKLFFQDKVSIGSGSDTAIDAYVRVSPPVKVHFSTDDIASETFAASCNCPAFQKGRLCKHVWAILLGVEQKYPDFLSSKRVIEKASLPSTEAAESESLDLSKSDKPRRGSSERQESYKAAAKERASLYRKVQYQKLKLRAKKQKREREGHVDPEEAHGFPPEIEDALSYFAVNGFPMASGPAEDILAEAKRKLSRVFHPDKGGSHEEIVELNRKCEILMEFLHGGSARKIGFMGTTSDIEGEFDQDLESE